MFRITNLMPVYKQDGSIIEYRVSVDNGSTDGNSVSANLVIGADDIDITAIADVCKQKLRETVGQKGCYNLTIETLGAYAGSLMAIILLIAYFVKPVVSSFSEITETLSKINHNLDLLNKDLEASKSDRQSIHDELKNHDAKLDSHSEKLVAHDEQLKTLFKERN